MELNELEAIKNKTLSLKEKMVKEYKLRNTCLEEAIVTLQNHIDKDYFSLSDEEFEFKVIEAINELKQTQNGSWLCYYNETKKWFCDNMDDIEDLFTFYDVNIKDYMNDYETLTEIINKISWMSYELAMEWTREYLLNIEDE